MNIKNDDCPICLEAFETLDVLSDGMGNYPTANSTCTHEICGDCILLMNRNKLHTCPLCRENIDVMLCEYPMFVLGSSHNDALLDVDAQNGRIVSGTDEVDEDDDEIRDEFEARLLLHWNEEERVMRMCNREAGVVEAAEDDVVDDTW